MAFLSEDEKQRLREKIEQVEKQTSSELVTVIAGQSDSYAFIPLLWASVVALALLPLAGLTGLQFSLVSLSALQLAVFLVLAVCFNWTPLKMRLVPKHVRLHRAARTAREQFLAQGVHDTDTRAGVLIFVSVAERYVEILADRAINEKVPQHEWDSIVADFVQAVTQGRIAAGFEQTVEACGARLAQHFPIQPGDKNELPDRLIEI